jgi:hypothetical protein
LRYSRIKIQTLLWKTASGQKKYISIFPSFIIKYNKVSTDLIEFISTNVGKDENVFDYIDDSGDLLEREDILVRSCKRVEHAILSKRLSALLSAKYTETFNTTISVINLIDYKKLILRFKEIRLCYWKQWKRIRTKHDNLKKLGINENKAWEYANTRKGYWRISNSPILAKTLSNKYLKEQGFITLTEKYLSLGNSY